MPPYDGHLILDTNSLLYDSSLVIRPVFFWPTHFPYGWLLVSGQMAICCILTPLLSQQALTPYGESA